MPSPRSHLITQARAFIQKASRLPGVNRIAMLGSLLSSKPVPQDVDLLLTITPEVDMAELAKLGRQLKGRLQGHNLGADIFLVNPRGKYLGRTCPWKHCAPGIRVRCEAQLGCGNYLYDDLHIITLAPALLKNPPLELWPHIIRRVSIPNDVEQDLIKYLQETT